MKITIKSNGQINDVIIRESERNGENVRTKTHETNGEIYAIEFDFTPPVICSDLEIWLSDSESDKLLDYAKMNLSKRNKMQFSKYRTVI
jgi:hypothetical protein